MNFQKQVCLNRSKGPFQGRKIQILTLFTHFDIFLPFIQKLSSNFFSIFAYSFQKTGLLESLQRSFCKVGKVRFGPFSHIYLCYAVVPKCCPIFLRHTVQITFIFIDFRVCDFAFAFKTQNAPCVSRFKRVLFSDIFQFCVLNANETFV